MLIATPRRIGLRVLLIALAWLCIHTPVAAEIPVEEALGIYENTIVEHRNLSPLWGLVALESGVLANVRFFAHYGPTARPAYPIHPSLVKGPGDDHPQDAISGVVQYLFPSPVDANLVANERNKDPIGEISIEQRHRRLTGKGEGGLKKIRLLLDASIAYRSNLASHPEIAARDFRDDVDVSYMLKPSAHRK
jgi:hypothetical protein